MLPVLLEKGSFYRAGINSTSFQNFRSTDGVAAPPSAIYFATRDASEEVKARVRAPQIKSLTPANGETAVDPKTPALVVVFDMPMGEGMSWVGGGPNFPKLPAGRSGVWSGDRQTCMLPVELEGEHDYRLGFNSLSHVNFQSAWGVPLAPVEYSFHTQALK